MLGFSFGVITAVLVAVFVLLSWQTRERLTRAIVENLETSQLRVANAEGRRQSERRLQASALAENPTLKAAVDTYHAERSVGAPTAQLLNTIHLELEKLQQRVQAPVLVGDRFGRRHSRQRRRPTLATGRPAAAWRPTCRPCSIRSTPSSRGTRTSISRRSCR